VRTDWVAFVDDDDTVADTFVKALAEEVRLD
jgi:hypothetical protein